MSDDLPGHALLTRPQCAGVSRPGLCQSVLWSLSAVLCQAALQKEREQEAELRERSNRHFHSLGYSYEPQPAPPRVPKLKPREGLELGGGGGGSLGPSSSISSFHSDGSVHSISSAGSGSGKPRPASSSSSMPHHGHPASSSLAYSFSRSMEAAPLPSILGNQASQPPAWSNQKPTSSRKHASSSSSSAHAHRPASSSQPYPSSGVYPHSSTSTGPKASLLAPTPPSTHYQYQPQAHAYAQGQSQPQPLPRPQAQPEHPKRPKAPKVPIERPPGWTPIQLPEVLPDQEDGATQQQQAQRARAEMALGLAKGPEPLIKGLRGWTGVVSPEMEEKLGEWEDYRKCAFCRQPGEDVFSGRLLPMEVDGGCWTHGNCAVWSSEAYEYNGLLHDVVAARIRSKGLKCRVCQIGGATVGCNAKGCKENYHFLCAVAKDSVFYEDRRVFCK